MDMVTYDQRLQYESILSQFKYDGLQLTVPAYESEENQLSNASAKTPAVRTKEGQLVSARYEHNIGQSDLQLYSHWNRFYWQDNIDDFLILFGVPGNGSLEFDNNGNNNIRWLNGFKLNYQATDNLTLLAGVEHEQRSTENNKFKDQVGGANLAILAQPPFSQPFEFQDDGSILLIEEGDISETSGFIQGDYQSNDWRYVLGLRYVDNEQSGVYTAPRASAVWSYTGTESIKILYGEGFNSPTFRQISGRNQLGIKQMVDVEAEVIRTYELAWVQSKSDYHQSLTIYFTEADKLIQTSSTGITNSNKSIERQGLEYELNYSSVNWSYLMSLTYLHQGDQNIKDDPVAKFNSKWLLRSGLERKWQSHKLGLSLRASSARMLVDEQYHLNAHYRYQLSAYEIFVTLNNVLDEDIIHPDVRAQQDKLVQSDEGTSIFAGIKIRFY